jgi:predicted metal-dependent hydrolase
VGSIGVSAGRVYDLPSLFDRLNRLYFDSQLKLQVRWSARALPKAKRSVLLGSYQDESKTITLSRRLDNPRVPLYFVEYVLFHEMLHAVFPRDDHRMHTEKFRTFERMHPDYERAVKWEKESFSILFEKSQGELNLPRREFL